MMDQHNTIKQEDNAFEDCCDDHIEIKIEEIPVFLEIKQEIEPESSIFGDFPTTPIELTKTHHDRKSSKPSNCERSFSKISNIVTDKRIQTNEDPFHCSYCHKCFYHKDDLVRHQKTHSGERPYQCSQCGKRLAQKGHLANHQRIHTGEKQKGALGKHQKIHTGEKPYQCSQCEKSFVQKGDLVRHQKIHTGEKLYQCSQCGKTFINKRYLLIHLRKHTLVNCSAKPFSLKHYMQFTNKLMELN